jgi:hypothetical protein
LRCWIGTVDDWTAYADHGWDLYLDMAT